ncbi:PucR C-terminal helix-turn-helix domain containing protein [Actinobacteria bacterium OK074]|nr:PucR C-terminal helix-turn-helix domain containing protein [Actinobacteria bacterium OK074]
MSPVPQTIEKLLCHLRRGTAPNPQGLVDWLHRQIGADIALLDGEGRVELSTGGLTPDLLATLLATLRPVLTRLSAGQLGAVTTQAGALRVQCEALGRPAPRPVLVVASPEPLTPEATALASHTGTVIEMMRRALHADDFARRFQQTASRLRLAVFMALMAEDVTLARRMTVSAVPPLLEAERLRVHLLACPPAERDLLADTYQDATGYHGRGLMVRCPVFEDHLICLVPAAEAGLDGEGCLPDEGFGPGGAGGGGDRHRESRDGHGGRGGDPGLDVLLRRLVRDDPRYVLGISAPHPLAATAQAYEQARHALAVARHAPDRVADHRGHTTPLARVLPAGTALAWARGLLRPLGTVPRLSLDAARLALAFPRTGVASLMDISRNTVTAHLRRVEEALGLDLHSAHSRATLALALSIAAPPEPGATAAGDAAVGGAPVGGAAAEDVVAEEAVAGGAVAGGAPAGEASEPTLDALLATPAARDWARAFLSPLLDPAHQAVHRTLRAWVEADTDAQRAAHTLDISRTTVRAHLRTAERLLNRDLLTQSPGTHDLVLALYIGDRAP